MSFPVEPSSQKSASSAGLSGRAAPAPERGLGTKRENVEHVPLTPSQKRREAHADQRRAAEIYRTFAPDGERMAGRGVCFCGWTRIANKRIKMKMVGAGTAAPRTFYEGLHKCDLGLVCPVCAKPKSEINRTWVNAGVAAGRKLGLHPLLMTLTTRHKRDDDLGALRKALAKAERALKTGQRSVWGKLKSGPMRHGFAKALEATWGARNGHHPHTHYVLLIEAEDEEDALRLVQPLREAWLRELEKVGLDGTSAAARLHAFDVRGSGAVGDYMTKWGADGWDVADEVTRATAKEGRGDRMTPWQLLRRSRTEPDDAGRLFYASRWWEFAQAFKGAHQLRMSPEFKSLAAAWLEENPPEVREESEPEEVFDFGGPEEAGVWSYARHKRLLMRENAEKAAGVVGGVAGAREAVRSTLVESRTDTDLVASDDPGSLLDDDPSFSPQVADQGDDFTKKREGGADEVEVVKHDDVSVYDSRSIVAEGCQPAHALRSEPSSGWTDHRYMLGFGFGEPMPPPIGGITFKDGTALMPRARAGGGGDKGRKTT